MTLRYSESVGKRNLRFFIIHLLNKEKERYKLMPKKPTSPFGYIAFSKNGKVTQHVDTLPDTQTGQEEEVMQRFCELYNSTNQERIEKFELLPQQDHDACIYINGVRIEVQITELLRRDYALKLTDEQYSKGQYQGTLIADTDGVFVIDSEKYINALTQKIQKKIGKCYSRPQSPLWLIIFCASAEYPIVWIENQEKKVSPALLQARQYIQNLEDCLFNEVWFFDLLLNPVKVA